MALVKYNNNSLSAITAAAAIPSGAMTLIKEQTASASSTISFVDGTSDVVLDSTYPIYKFVWINAHPSGDGNRLTFQGNVAGGSGYNETITSSFFRADHTEADGGGALAYQTAVDQAQGTGFQPISYAMSSDTDHSSSGFLYLFNPSSTTFVKHFIVTTNEVNDNDGSYQNFVAGYFNTTSAIDEIQFKMDGGNIDTGTFKLYGIKDS